MHLLDMSTGGALSVFMLVVPGIWCHVWRIVEADFCGGAVAPTTFCAYVWTIGHVCSLCAALNAARKKSRSNRRGWTDVLVLLA